MHRRTFIKSLSLAGLGLAGGWLPGRSWAESPGLKPLKLVFYTDIHTRLEWETPQGLAHAAECINAEQADMVIAGGDLITDGFQNGPATAAPRWDAYMKMHRAIRPDVLPVLGNHDLVAAAPEDGTTPLPDPRRPFLEHMGLERTYRSFDAAGRHFILLDSVWISGDEFKYHGYIGPEQIEWLKEDLSRVPASQPIILVSHIPLISTYFQFTRESTAAAPVNRIVKNSREVLDCFTAHRLQLVLQGHHHVNELIRWRGTTFITGGAVCGKWWRGSWRGTEEGYGVVRLEDDRVHWAYRDMGWEARRP